jgi:GTPase SAR1 family protein
MIKIVLTGPESTGKTTLAKQLANYLETAMVPESARHYIDNLDRPYLESDLLEIAKKQIELEKQQITKAQRILICDTDLITIKIWSEYKYQRCDPQILKWIEQEHYDHYLLCVGQGSSERLLGLLGQADRRGKVEIGIQVDVEARIHHRGRGQRIGVTRGVGAGQHLHVAAFQIGNMRASREGGDHPPFEQVLNLFRR